MRIWGRGAWAVGLLLLAGPARAQREYSQWYFGIRSAVAFTGPTLSPQPVFNSAMVSGEGCASVADAQGNLLFYTNGIDAWNRLHQPLANGFGLGGFGDAQRTETAPSSSTQGAAILRRPGSSTDYYIFALDAAENNLRNGLRYSVVDVSRQGGLGEVTQKNLPLPVPVGDGRLTEKMALVRHANQRDYWLVVHAWNSNVFASFLITPAGIEPVPLLSAGGQVQQGGINLRQDYNALGCLKISPDGQRLAQVLYSDGVAEVFDFNHGTGTVSNPRRLPGVGSSSGLGGSYGVEFSPNSQLLYVTGTSDLPGTSISQYDLRTGVRTGIGVGFGAIQAGPDQRLYVSNIFTSNNGLAIIAAPDQPGLACGFVPLGVTWNSPGRFSYFGLPLVPVLTPPLPDVRATFGVLGTDVCLGETTRFTAAIYPFPAGAVVSWEFGEPASGANNQAVGLSVSHRYASVGTFRATMTVREVGGRQYSYAQSVVIRSPGGGGLLPVPLPVCAGQTVVLSLAANPPNTVVRWQDGSTGPTLAVQRSGTYRVAVTPPGGCTLLDSVRLNFLPRPVVAFGPNRRLGCQDSLRLDPGPQPAGSTFRWLDGSRRPRLSVGQLGTYGVTVTVPGGCPVSATVEVIADENCPIIVPNIITPNGDGLNEALVLQGVGPGVCDLLIFNRWGQPVYQQTRYRNDWAAAGLAPGLYYYLLTVPLTRQRFKGWVEVMR